MPKHVMHLGDVGLASRNVSKALLALGLAMAILIVFGRPLWYSAYTKLTGRRTVADVVYEYGTDARARLAPALDEAGIDYPPVALTLLAFKEERELELWARTSGDWHLVHTYPILGASGGPGPKLHEGDRQVPEGVYRIIGLNPNSSLHLSMKLDYPNGFDVTHAEQDGRDNLGGDIFIHGKDISVGCIAVGDPAIEELFILVDDVGSDNVTVLVAPSDPREGPLERGIEDAPEWLPELYDLIEKEFEPFYHPNA